MKMSDKKRLIPEFEYFDAENLSDVYMLCARAIEQTFLDADAVPGVDYSYMDLMNLAQPHVLNECANKAIDIKVWQVKK